MDSMSVIIVGDRAKVYTPYNETFVSRLKSEVGGRKWDPESRCWTVPTTALDVVRSIMMDVYGETDERSSDRVDVLLTFEDEEEELCGAIVCFGRTIVRAWGRDSGTKLGDGVTLIKGSTRSGGSLKNWKTVVEAGSVFRVTDVPRAAFDAAGYPPDFAQIISQSIDTDALRAERERLMTRVAEIDATLAEIA